MEMRAECERCHAATAETEPAHVCSHECTFCPTCEAALGSVCPNCGGELCPRPRRGKVALVPPAPFRVSEPYRPRPTRFREVIEVAGWRLKVHEITRGEPFEWERFVPGLALLALPHPAVTADRPGVGFLVAHQGRGADYLVAGAWCGENECPLFVAVREQVAGARWRHARATEAACVWDLDVIAAERTAYVTTVLGEGGGGVDVEGYLAAHLSLAEATARFAAASATKS